MGKAAPAIVTVVAVVATVYAGPLVGEAIYASLGTSAAATGVSTATVGAAAIGGSTSAVNAAVQGKNLEGVLKAGAIGAASGAAGQAIGGEITSGVTELTGGPVAIPSDVGPTLGPTAAGSITGGAAGGAASGFTRAQLSGQNLERSGQQALIGGATGAITSAIGEGFRETGALPEDVRLAKSLSGPFVSGSVADLFTPQRPSSQVGQTGPSTQFVGSAPTTGEPAPGTAALGQALRIGSAEPGAPIESPGGGESTSRPVWNIASLRVKDETGSQA